MEPSEPGARLAAAIKASARALGFDQCGITHAGPIERRQVFLDWLARGDHGAMAYMARDPDRRCTPTAVWPEARSIVVVGIDRKSVV